MKYFRWREDGSANDSGATWHEAEDVDVSLTSSDNPFSLRIGLQETAGGFGVSPAFQLQTRKNGGSWGDVTSVASDGIRPAAGSRPDSDDNTQNYFSGLTGTQTSSDCFDEVQGLVTVGGFVLSNGFVEIEYSIQIVDANTSDGDTFDFRVTSSGHTITETLLPGLTNTDPNTIKGTPRPTIAIRSEATTVTRWGDLYDYRPTIWLRAGVDDVIGKTGLGATPRPLVNVRSEALITGKSETSFLRPFLKIHGLAQLEDANDTVFGTGNLRMIVSCQLQVQLGSKEELEGTPRPTIALRANSLVVDGNDSTVIEVGADLRPLISVFLRFPKLRNVYEPPGEGEEYDNASTQATAEDYRGVLKSLLPPGSWWERLGSQINDLLLGMAQELARFDARANALKRESDPRTTNEMIDDWEQALGLPSACFRSNTVPELLGERRAAVVALLRRRATRTAADIIEIAADAGYTIQVQESVPGANQVTINGPETSIQYSDCTGFCDERLTTFGIAVLECIIEASLPAHVQPFFVYDL